MKHFASFAKALVLGFTLFGAAAHATDLANFTDALSATDPTQSGRLSRSGVPSDWSTQKTYPGLVAGGPFHYRTYSFTIAAGTYLQFSIDDPSAAIFASAYLGNYNPASQSTNYLGDAGSTGNSFGTNPASFQLYVPTLSTILLVINEVPGAGTTTGIGTGFAYNVLLEGFIDTMFTDLPVRGAVPEPETLLLLVGPLAFMAIRRRMKKTAEPMIAA